MNATSSKSIIPELAGWEDRLALAIQNAAARSTIGRQLSKGGGIARKPPNQRTPEQLDADFWMQVEVKEKSECWPWLGTEGNNGYGVFCFGGRRVTASRYTAIIRYGPLTRKDFACHHCDNPICVNPNHLFIGDWKANAQDMVIKGIRHRCRGAENGCALLTEDQVRQIKISAQTRTRGFITRTAEKYKVSVPTISSIVVGRNWAHVLPEIT